MKNVTRNISVLVAIITLLSCKQSVETDKLVIGRIEHIYNLKLNIDNNIWPGFSNAQFDVPLIYYTENNCYVANPTDKFLRLINSEPVYKSKTLLVYKTNLLDSIRLHMEARIELDDTSVYNYHEPYMKCSSPELTDKFIPDVYTTEMWSTMVMHEYFHGFQFKHAQFLDFYHKNVNISADTLNRLYKSNNWFKESVDKENELLLKAIDSYSETDIQQAIEEFFKLKDYRFKQTSELLNSDIKTIEENYETMEGTSRYIEFCLYNKFATMQPDVNIVKLDSFFNSYRYFENYSITKDEWLYLTGAHYYYSIGFNMLRLLDKLKVDYKNRLFNENIFLSDILREQI